MNTDAIFAGGTGQRRTNFLGIALNIVDSYPMGLSHGVQKDAIQNGWDAALHHTAEHISRNWGMDFELKQGPQGMMLIMRDYGTVGMTGKLTSEDEYSSVGLPEEERWARWESLAFTKSDRRSSLGARGQGKMIFLYASNKKTILYDSFRLDRTYRFGAAKITDKDAPIKTYDGREAGEKLAEYTGLKPLNAPGSRVIIIDPCDELVESIKSGSFITAIEETWWPAIQKFGAQISLKHDGTQRTAGVPGLFPIDESKPETKTFKRMVWEKLPLEFGGNHYRIKRLCVAATLDGEVPEQFQGVSVFRGCMKVNSVDFTVRQYRKNVYGYVEFERALDEMLYTIEEPDHYAFRPVGENTGLWRKIKTQIEDCMDEFGTKKLGLGIDKRSVEARKRSDAEKAALNLLRKLTAGWAFKGKNKGVGGNDPGDGPDPDLKDVGVRLNDIEFPNDTGVPRLNYGESLSDFTSEVFNKTKEDITCALTIAVYSGDRIVRQIEPSKRIIVGPTARKRVKCGPYNLTIDKETFEPGEYVLNATLSDDLSAKKERIDRVRRRFWVETEPELKGPFDIEKRHFSEIPRPDIQNLEWFLQSNGSNHYTFVYNLDHPAYSSVFEEEEQLIAYLSEIFALGAAEIVLKNVRRQSPEEVENTEPFSKEAVFSSDPHLLYRDTIRVLASIRKAIYS